MVTNLRLQTKYLRVRLAIHLLDTTHCFACRDGVGKTLTAADLAQEMRLHFQKRKARIPAGNSQMDGSQNGV